MKANVLDKQSVRNCTSCGICASVCGSNAIKLEYNSEGFYRPVIDESKCVECGLCKMACYKYDTDFKLKDEFIACYAAWNNNKEQLKLSSSGGISCLLMEECIVRGYKVFGCTYDLHDNKAKSIVVSSREDLEQFHGSKYFQSYTVNGFKEILKDKTEQKYAIFGTPCQIYAFSQTNKYKRYPERYLLVDIFCHGCPSVMLWNTYRKEREIKSNVSRFDGIAFRSKTYGWHEYSIDFCAKKKKYTSKKTSDPFFGLFFGADIMNEACYDCKARSTMAYADIRIGDFWGSKYEMNRKGVSAIIVKSDIGNSFIEAIKDKVTIEQADFYTIISAQSYGKVVNHDDKRRSYLMSALKVENDINKIYSNYQSMLPFQRWLKLRLKAFVKILPPSLFFPIRKLLHSL